MTTAPAPDVAVTDTFLGQPLRVGGGLETVTVAPAELFPVLGSCVEELTVTELLITAPFGVGQLTIVTSVIVCDAPAATELKLTVRSLPEPSHKPFPVEAHERNVTEVGRLSVTTTDAALPGPWLVTVMVQVTFEPATIGLADALSLIATSASDAGRLPTAKSVALLMA